MAGIRTSRTRLLTAAATVALATLSLTACSDGTGITDEGASAGSSTTASSSATAPESTASSSGASGQDSTSGASGQGSSSGDAKQDAGTSKVPASTGKKVTCEGSSTKTVAALLTRPLNHMLLTVTNTGSSTCHLYGYPAVRFGEAQSVPPVIEGSRPQAVVTLEPGESGYASVNLSAADGSGSSGRTEKSLAVYFRGPSGNESVGEGANPALPAEGVYVDDSLKVTYWQQSMEDAVMW
ncbi:DUF4232 domain-containing protein [Streptomyces sp. QTS137]